MALRYNDKTGGIHAFSAIPFLNASFTGTYFADSKKACWAKNGLSEDT